MLCGRHTHTLMLLDKERPIATSCVGAMATLWRFLVEVPTKVHK